MRLIDADKALEWIDIEYPKLDRQDMKQMINAQPTSYDIDKIVEQLEKVSFVDVDEEYADDGQIILFLHDAIEIVKGGSE